MINSEMRIVIIFIVALSRHFIGVIKTHPCFGEIKELATTGGETVAERLVASDALGVSFSGILADGLKASLDRNLTGRRHSTASRPNL